MNSGDHSDAALLAILVHEVRSPVAALAALSAALAADRLERTERRALAALAVAACRSIERVVTDLAVTSVRLEDVDAGRLVREAVSAATLGGASVRAVVDPGLPELRADPLRLRQALDNLVENALVHGAADGEVVVAAEIDNEAVLLSVSDTGKGIRAENQGRVFEAGARLEGDSAGAGLGLAIARAIAEAHGGTLSVESALGKGSTFTLRLPLA